MLHVIEDHAGFAIYFIARNHNDGENLSDPSKSYLDNLSFEA